MLDTRKVFLHVDLMAKVRRHPPHLSCVVANCGEPYEWIQAHITEAGLSGYRHHNAYCAVHARAVVAETDIPCLDDMRDFETFRSAIKTHLEAAEQHVNDDLLAQKARILERHERAILRSVGSSVLAEDRQGRLFVSCGLQDGRIREESVCCEAYGHRVLVCFPHGVQGDVAHSSDCRVGERNVSAGRHYASVRIVHVEGIR